MEQKEKGIIETWKQYDCDFHLACIRACGSNNLLRLHSNLFDQVSSLPVRSSELPWTRGHQ